MKDLLRLYSFESVHKTDDEILIADFICGWLDNNGIDYNRKGNNIFRIRAEKTVPILSAHLDQVKTNGRAEHFFLRDDTIHGYNCLYEHTSLGGDDKNGVWIILKCLEAGIDIDFVISAGEECGCVGIRELEEANVLDNIFPDRFCIVLDRRGNWDVLEGGSASTYCKTLAQDICNYLVAKDPDNNYKVTTGSLSDTATLCMYCESVNMSVAYDSPHSASETTNWKQLQKILEDVKLLCTEFVHYSTDPTVYVYKSKYNTYNFYSGKDKKNGKESDPYLYEW